AVRQGGAGCAARREWHAAAQPRTTQRRRPRRIVAWSRRGRAGGTGTVGDALRCFRRADAPGTSGLPASATLHAATVARLHAAGPTHRVAVVDELARRAAGH